MWVKALLRSDSDSYSVCVGVCVLLLGRPPSAPGACWSWGWRGLFHSWVPVCQLLHTSPPLSCTLAPSSPTRCTPVERNVQSVVFVWTVEETVKLTLLSYLFRGLVEGDRGIDKLESVLHLQHELLPVWSHALGTVSDQVHVVVVGLKQSLRFLLNLQGTLVCFLQKGERSGLQLVKEEEKSSFKRADGTTQTLLPQ